MRFSAIASDYDGTIAEKGVVSSSTVASLQRFRDAGGTLILVTGREVADLQNVFPQLTVFHWIVAENGALLYHLATGVETLLVSPPPLFLIDALRSQQVGPLYIGRIIIATHQHHEAAVRKLISGLGVSVQVILNKDALMILPEGVNKATGLQALFHRIGISKEQTVGVGDAENDAALFEACGRSVAVANALPALKDRADWVTSKTAGDGMTELIDSLLA